MQIPFGDLKRQYISIKDEIDEAIRKVLNRGSFILGENVESFEREFSNFCGAKFGIGVGSGTEALHLSLVSCGVQAGDEVITVANTAVPTVSAISFANATPVFVDIDPESYNINPSKIEEKISKRTKVILPVHLYGQPADMDSILEVAKRHKLKVIEDACHAHGAEYKGRRVGTLGNIGCFSFYPTKNLNAYGDGGMALTNDEEIAIRLKMLRNYGEERRYHNPIKGFNSRLDEIQAAILRVKLKYLSKWNERRRKIAESYNNLLKTVIKPKEMDYTRHIYHLYVVRSTKRDQLQMYLQEEGIGTLIHYPVPIHLQPAYRDLGFKKGSLPITEKYANEILSLPIFPELTDEEIKYISNTVNSFQIGKT
jgi:dTDP-4-amino-4,6-dideoxygalactose transaminase